LTGGKSVHEKSSFVSATLMPCDPPIEIEIIFIDFTGLLAVERHGDE
jgi:hypothetical protein